MTYVLSWKTESEVFLTADTALTTLTTSPDPPKLDLAISSFGEKHFVSENKKVEERTLKLFLKNNIGIALAGNYRLAINIVKTFYNKVEEGLNPKNALKESLFLNQPFPKDTNVQLAIAYYNNGPQLLSFNSRGDNKIRDNETLLHLGCPPPLYKEMSEDWLMDISKKTEGEPRLQLSSMLGILQSYGIMTPSMESGIGGAFSGLFIDGMEASWQPDTCFIIDDNIVNTCIRNDCFVINSPTIGESRCFLTYLPPQPVELLKKQAEEAIKKGEELRKLGKYDYLIFMKTKNKSLTLVVMNKNNKHSLVWLEPYAEGNISGTQFSLFPKLRALLDRKNGGLIIIPYIESQIKEIPQNRIIRREVKPKE